MFIAVLFVISRTWKQSRSPSTIEWIKQMWYIYTKSNGVLVNCNAVELEKTILREITRTQKENSAMHSPISRY